MATRRRYTKSEKVAALVAAEAVNLSAAAEQTGIPRTTIRQWRDSPEYAELRQNAREVIAEQALVAARLAWEALTSALRNGELGPRDLIMAAGMATDKAQLLNGGATARTEARDITGTISDAELIAAVREADAIASRGRTAEEAPGTPEG